MLRFPTRSHTGGETDKTPGKGPLLNPVLLAPAPTPVCSCDDSPGCYISKSVCSCLSKFILSKILVSSGSLSMIDMLRSTVKLHVYQLEAQFLEASILETFLTLCSSYSLTGHASLAKVGGVSCLVGSLRSLQSQSASYSAIRNSLTMHSKPSLL